METTTPSFAALPGRGVTLHVASAGPEGGPPVVLLHGFPEFWYSWRRQIGPLAEAGFRVLAPDQRGYNLSEKPRGLVHYHLDHLADDVAALIAATPSGKAAVVGHDWGGVVAWWLALRRPELVERLAILNAPHPDFLTSGRWVNPWQLWRSWYVLAFQIPWFPETSLGAFHGLGLARALRSTSRPGTFRDEELDVYRAAWAQLGALRGMINWYRAALRARPEPPADPRIHVPTLIIWGARDAYLDRRFAGEALARCDQGRLEMIADATHWVHHEEAQRVTGLLLEFLTTLDTSARPRVAEH